MAEMAVLLIQVVSPAAFQGLQGAAQAWKPGFVERYKLDKTEFAPQSATRTGSKYFAYIFKVTRGCSNLANEGGLDHNPQKILRIDFDLWTKRANRWPPE